MANTDNDPEFNKNIINEVQKYVIKKDSTIDITAHDDVPNNINLTEKLLPIVTELIKEVIDSKENLIGKQEWKNVINEIIKFIYSLLTLRKLKGVTSEENQSQVQTDNLGNPGAIKATGGKKSRKRRSRKVSKKGGKKSSKRRSRKVSKKGGKKSRKSRHRKVSKKGGSKSRKSRHLKVSKKGGKKSKKRRSRKH